MRPNKKNPLSRIFFKLVRPAGFEPTTLGFGGRYSIQLSYGRILNNRHNSRFGGKNNQNFSKSIKMLDGIGKIGYRKITLLGRSQAVRQRTLTPSFAGSSPAAPATSKAKSLKTNELGFFCTVESISTVNRPANKHPLNFAGNDEPL